MKDIRVGNIYSGMFAEMMVYDKVSCGVGGWLYCLVEPELI